MGTYQSALINTGNLQAAKLWHERQPIEGRNGISLKE